MFRNAKAHRHIYAPGSLQVTANARHTFGVDDNMFGGHCVLRLGVTRFLNYRRSLGGEQLSSALTRHYGSAEVFLQRSSLEALLCAITTPHRVSLIGENGVTKNQVCGLRLLDSYPAITLAREGKEILFELDFSSCKLPSSTHDWHQSQKGPGPS
jgi:hypothetical protein